MIAWPGFQVSVIRYQVSRFLSFEGGMDIDSRYFATVLRATCIPDATSVLAILLSLKGLPGSSFAMNFLIIALMAVAEHSPPSEVDT